MCGELLTKQSKDSNLLDFRILLTKTYDAIEIYLMSAKPAVKFIAVFFLSLYSIIAYAESLIVGLDENKSKQEMASLLESFGLPVGVPSSINLHFIVVQVPCDAVGEWISILNHVKGVETAYINTTTFPATSSIPSWCIPENESIYLPQSETLVIPRLHTNEGDVYRVELSPPFNISALVSVE